MKINKKSTNTKKIWLIAAPVIIALATLTVYFALAKDDPSTPPGKINQLLNGSDKDSTENSKKENPKSEDKVTPPNTDHAETPKPDKTTGKLTIPIIASADIDGSAVFIRGGLNTPRADGACFALLSGPNGQEVKKETTLLTGAGTSDCKTISVPISELSLGKWSVTLNYVGDNAEGRSDVQTFIIK